MRNQVIKIASDIYCDMFGEEFDRETKAWLRTLPEDEEQLELLTLEDAGYELSAGMFDCLQTALIEVRG